MGRRDRLSGEAQFWAFINVFSAIVATIIVGFGIERHEEGDGFDYWSIFHAAISFLLLTLGFFSAGISIHRHARNATLLNSVFFFLCLFLPYLYLTVPDLFFSPVRLFTGRDCNGTIASCIAATITLSIMFQIITLWYVVLRLGCGYGQWRTKRRASKGLTEVHIDLSSGSTEISNYESKFWKGLSLRAQLWAYLSVAFACLLIGVLEYEVREGVLTANSLTNFPSYGLLTCHSFFFAGILIQGNAPTSAPSNVRFFFLWAWVPCLLVITPVLFEKAAPGVEMTLASRVLSFLPLYVGLYLVTIMGVRYCAWYNGKGVRKISF